MFASVVWFASQLFNGSKRERGAMTLALENNRELLKLGKSTSQAFEILKRGLEP